MKQWRVYSEAGKVPTIKAIVIHRYGGPEVLRFKEYPDPVPGPGKFIDRQSSPATQ